MPVLLPNKTPAIVLEKRGKTGNDTEGRFAMNKRGEQVKASILYGPVLKPSPINISIAENFKNMS